MTKKETLCLRRMNSMRMKTMTRKMMTMISSHRESQILRLMSSEEKGDLALENNKEVLSLRTFPAFELLGVSCFSLSEAEVFVPSAKTKGAKKAERCNPLNRIALEFSVPVSLQGLADGVQVAPPLVKGVAPLRPVPPYAVPMAVPFQTALEIVDPPKLAVLVPKS